MSGIRKLKKFLIVSIIIIIITIIIIVVVVVIIIIINLFKVDDKKNLQVVNLIQ